MVFPLRRRVLGFFSPLSTRARVSHQGVLVHHNVSRQLNTDISRYSAGAQSGTMKLVGLGPDLLGWLLGNHQVTMADLAEKTTFVLKTIIKEELLGHIKEMDIPKAAWDTLALLFSKKNHARLQLLENKLMTISQGNMIISQYFMKWSSQEVILPDSEEIEIKLQEKLGEQVQEEEKTASEQEKSGQPSTESTSDEQQLQKSPEPWRTDVHYQTPKDDRPSQFEDIEEETPKESISYEEAVTSKEWRNVMDEEIQALKKNQNRRASSRHIHQRTKHHKVRRVPKTIRNAQQNLIVSGIVGVASISLVRVEGSIFHYGIDDESRRLRLQS
uniref:Uncharacterized protein n=1 Tax=Ananas comosus var. bracteatus TaxID=296719 RepID=A0A6V7NZD0_ANACO|nr:unnamed protein product [Ananas comosus var. bracteatus]